MLLKNKKSDTRYRTDKLNDPKNFCMSTQLENGSPLSFDTAQFELHLPQIYRVILNNFRRIAQTYVSFNIIFLCLIILEGTLFLALMSFLSKPAFALSLGILFLTCFSYFLLLFYFQAKKPEQLVQIKEQFIQSCRRHISLPPGEAQHHLSIADALTNLSCYLQDFESNFYRTPALLAPINRIISRFASYCYWEDVFKIKEILLQTAIQEHLIQIRSTPTDLEVHASLANTYVFLSKLYKDFLESEKKKYRTSSEEGFRLAAQLAIEEFKILNHYAPHDPWVHEQLAIGYKNLNMPKEEISEIEILLKLKPQDKEILFRLGALCFQEGQNARGLQIYEELKQSNYKRASDLISSYGPGKKTL